MNETLYRVEVLKMEASDGKKYIYFAFHQAQKPVEVAPDIYAMHKENLELERLLE